ncbi:MAG: hypothetical protein WD206_09840, partial [Actinomycetota bacterium]
MNPEGPLRVVIAADSAMNRDIVRFFLQEDGFEIVGDAARAEDAAWMAAKFGADAVILQESIAAEEAQEAIHRLRAQAPSTRIVVVTPEGSAGPAMSATRGADSYLEAGVGLVDLALVLRTITAEPASALGAVAPATPVPVRPQDVHVPDAAAAAPLLVPEFGLEDTPKRRLVPERLSLWLGGGRQRLVPILAGAAALLLAVSLVLSRSSLSDALFPQQAGPQFAGVAEGPSPSIYVEASLNRVDALVVSLQGFDVEEAPNLARELVEERQRAIDAGASDEEVAELDAVVEEKLRPVIQTAPERVAAAVLTILAPVFPWAEEDLGDFIEDGIVPPGVDIPGSDAGTTDPSTSPITSPSQTSGGSPDPTTDEGTPAGGNDGGGNDGGGNDGSGNDGSGNDGGNDGGGNDGGGNDGGGNNGGGNNDGGGSNNGGGNNDGG